ncbi:MAG: phosphate ABC transporter substrate-binding protein PstS [Promicromonosporaceae bacterium]|nr:phosphate ABC transporter substrate-binding protein PstS [Promicromonosporaceae bacterium]
MHTRPGAHRHQARSKLISAALLPLLVAACISDTPAGGGSLPGVDLEGGFPLSGQFVGAGASTQQSAMEAWIAYFQDPQPRVTVIYDPNGSGAGRTQFLNGGALWAGSDVVLTGAEVENSVTRCGPEGAIDLPVYVSPIAIAFNLPGITELNLRPSVIARIFTRDITNWNDSAIAADNPTVTLPNLTITPIHRTDNSGTTTNFTEYLAATAPDVWPWDPAGTWPFAGGESAQGTSGVVNVVNSTRGAVTYVDYSQVGTLGAAAILVGDSWVPVSAEAAVLALDASPQLGGRHELDLAIDLDRTTTAAGAYPLLLISYAVICLHYDSEMDAEFVRSFMTWITSEPGQDLASEVAGSAPLSSLLRSQISDSLAAITFS